MRIMSKSLRINVNASTFFLYIYSYNRICLNTGKGVEGVLRIICGCVIFGKFLNGLFVAIACEKDAEVFCHTWKTLFGGDCRGIIDLCHCDFTHSLYIDKTGTIPYACQYMHDSSGTKN